MNRSHTKLREEINLGGANYYSSDYFYNSLAWNYFSRCRLAIQAIGKPIK
ncbi:MAG: hypothetical protein ABWZ79_08540 [Pedobacter agri]